MSWTRRQFIAISGTAAGAATAVSGLTSNLWGLTPDVVPDPQTDGDKVVATFCEMCFWKCGVLAHVKDDRITKIVGNPEHPLSQGRLCPRGTGGAGLVYDPDRLTKPLVRVERDGEQVFEEVSWEEALDRVAEGMKGVAERHGPEAFAMFYHGYGANWFKSLMKAYGTPNVTAPSFAQCRGSRETAFGLTYGAPVGSPEVTDIENTRVLTLIGSHLGENMHNTQVQELAKAIERGAELVVVDPRYSTAAGKAKYWLPIKPGTDIALLLAWMHVIVKEGLYDRDYIEQNAVGFEELKAHLADKTPEWAFTETTIRPEVIVETARFIAGAAPASLVHPGRRASWYGDDTQRGRAVAILNALLGAWGREGGFYVPDSMSVPGYPGLPHPHVEAEPADMPPGTVYPFGGSTLAHGVRDATIPGKGPYDIKGWMVYGTNLMGSLPDRKATIAAMDALEFMVAIDVLPAEITGYADVILPEASYLERYDDLHSPPFRRGYVALRQPAVAPVGESKPGWWIAKELAKRLGHEDLFPWEDMESYLAKRLELGGWKLDEMQKTGVIVKERGPITTNEGVELSFGTPSGKIELYSQQMADVGLPPLPDYTPPRPIPAGSFRLLFGRAPVHTFGRTTNNRFLGQIMPENELWMNAQTAEELGLRNGERVTLVNELGETSGSLPLKATQRIRPDCVYMVHGFGHHDKRLRFGNDRGASDNDLVTRAPIDPVMGGTGLNDNFVRVQRVNA